MQRALANILLLLLLLCLLPVFLATQRPEVIGLGVLLLAAGFFLAYTRQPRGLEILAVLVLVLSFVGVAFWGRLLAGTNGAYCLVGLWSLLLVGAVALFYRRAVLVERGQILVINQLPENRIVVWNEGLHRPLRPFVERRMAALPAYELTQECVLEQVNTRSLFNVDRLEILVRYQVAQPRAVVVNFPNREQAYDQLARERGLPREDDTDEQVAFWTELIRRQMELEIEQATRSVIANVAGPTEVATERETYARLIRQRLEASVRRWGIHILDVRLLDVVIAPERVRMVNRDKILERERADARRRAEMRAEEILLTGQAQAEATARMVAEMVKALQQQGTTLTTDEIERIVLTALQRVYEQRQLGALLREAAQSSTPPGGNAGTTHTDEAQP